MLFNSIHYLIFFPVVTLFYFVIPEKIRYLWLLAASYFFYICWNAKYGLLIFFSTFVTWVSGIALDRLNQKADRLHPKTDRFGQKEDSPEEKRITSRKKAVAALCLLLNLGLLFYFKYTDFAFRTAEKLFGMAHIKLHVPSFDIVLPVGISFFIFQALGYMIDVYRGERGEKGGIRAEYNFFRYALFVSFFPQLVAGPIERSKNLLLQLREPKAFDSDNARSGLLTMGYGLFLKIVLADRIAAVADPVFASPDSYAGMELLAATLLFAFQIYCDFQGYTKLAIGSAKVLGIRLNENFDSPYHALSVKDFWRRWHISLTSWFRDYLYIPLGGSRKGRVRKYINTMIVFLSSGLWHGAAWHYVVWGGLNGTLSVLEDLLRPVKEKLCGRFSIDRKRFGYRILQRAATFVIIDFTWLFFRADSFRLALHMLKRILFDFRWEWFLNMGFVSLFESADSMMVIAAALFVLLAVDSLQYLRKDIKAAIFGQQIVFRWIFYWLFFMAILYWGLYGTGYEQTQFIYFQF